MITYDEAKRQINIAKHGMDFVGAEALFDGPVITAEDARLTYGEQRLNTIGLLHGAVVFMTYRAPQRSAHHQPETRHAP